LPGFFNCLNNDLIVILRDSGLGYNMSDVNCGCIFFSDDILLLSASECKLQTMLNLCITFASAVDLSLIMLNLMSPLKH
jgi:hypothetical protein